MRELILYMSMSLDGLVASDREHPGVAVADAEVKQWKLEQISKAGAHLMGRKTYQEMSAYWPDSEDAYAAPMNDIAKVVFSSTLSDDEATSPQTRVARGDLATEIGAIKAEPGPDVIAWGRRRLRRRPGRGEPDRRVPPVRPAAGAGQRSSPVRQVARRPAPGPG